MFYIVNYISYISCNEKYQCAKKNRIDDKERKRCEHEFEETEELPKCQLCKKNHWRCKGENCTQCCKLACCNNINCLNCQEQGIRYE